MEKHLVVSVGEEVYVALAKGPLNAEHVLILPITHYPAGSQLPDNVWAEVLLTYFFVVYFILPFLHYPAESQLLDNVWAEVLPRP